MQLVNNGHIQCVHFNRTKHIIEVAFIFILSNRIDEWLPFSPQINVFGSVKRLPQKRPLVELIGIMFSILS
ncbi:hypothetical protein C0J52_17486 [Blattella germanica]|nr:hypothetical protein C0J52_17486 [Blattella germanica]